VVLRQPTDVWVAAKVESSIALAANAAKRNAKQLDSGSDSRLAGRRFMLPLSTVARA
jgi:hypothetical protein